MEKAYGSLSSSESRTLEHLAEAEHHPSEFDWIALHRLIQFGLAEERSKGVALTQEGRRALQRLISDA